MEVLPSKTSDFTPASSHSATPAPPSPDRDHSPAMVEDTSDNRRGTLSEKSYTTLGQLAYAPATQTTVVTTTTTTTTTFPPLVVKEPIHLHARDRKQYPLAAAPTPAAMRNFSFSIQGKPICFQETDDLRGSLLQFNQEHANLQAHNGSVRSFKASEVTYETPKKSKDQRVLERAFHPEAEAVKMDKKRTVSIADAAELASLQRRHKRSRLNSALENTPPALNSRQGKSKLSQSFESVGQSFQGSPAEPNMNAGHNGQSRASKTKLRSRRTAGKSTPEDSQEMNEDGSQSGQNAARKQIEGLENSALEAYVPAMSATPPIVEEDLELAHAELPPVDITQRRPRLLDTLAAQDASLPSPSLSPITAAANLSNANGVAAAAEDIEDDGYDVSSLDIAQDKNRTNLRRVYQDSKSRPHEHLNMSPTTMTNEGGLPTPTLMDIPTMLDTFDAMPPDLQSYFMYQMLRRCAKPTLHMVADVVNPALKCDFLALLPLELSMNIVRNFDVQTMCRAAQVSRRWRQIVDSDETAWKALLDSDELHIPKGEVERAVKEGWGWQFPYGRDCGEQDLTAQYGYAARKSGPASSPAASPYAISDYTVPSSSSRPKRKAKSSASVSSSSKKRKIKAAAAARQHMAPWLQSLEHAQGPNAHANAALMAIPNPDIGLPSLRNLHLYKSIYRRHHAIKQGWMNEDTQPHHIAFRAHGRHVVTCLQFDSDKIITGSDDTRIHIYETKTGREVKQLTGHDGGVWALQYDGNILVSGSTDRSVRIWDIEKGKCVQQFLGHTSTVRCLVILKPTKIGEEADGTPIIMPKEPLIITGSRDSTLRVWKLPSIGDPSIMQDGYISRDSDNPYFVRALTGHHHSVRAIAAHGDTLVSGSYDHSVRVWKISTGDLLHRLSGHSAKVYSVVLDHERNRCISGSMDNSVRVWSLETGAQLYQLDGHTSLVGLLDLNYNRLVSAAADSTLRIWDPENGHCKNTLSAHTGAITCFQHDDQKVISGSDRTLKLWNVKTGEWVKDLLTDLSGVWQVKFNERRCVAAVQRDNLTYIEVLDFGAARDGCPKDLRGVRTVVDRNGEETAEATDSDAEANAE